MPPHRTPHTDSPSQNTRSRGLNPPDGPAYLTPVKKRAQRSTKRLVDLSDIDIWPHSDEKIIAEHVKSWTSPAYDHYIITLVRHFRDAGHTQPGYMEFVFTCKYNPENHHPQTRRRDKTGSGTSNLQRAMNRCNQKRPISSTEHNDQESQSPTPLAPYHPAVHRAMIALHCAVNHRPFELVHDPLYRLMISYLRPSVVLPSPEQVANDVTTLYTRLCAFVKQHFSGYRGVVHLVGDGWTSPLVSAFFGIILIWYENGQIWRTTLDFARLSQAHTGAYLAGVTHQVFERFGISHLIFSACLDNASNCDSMIKELAILNPKFLGMKMRTRCFAHILNLVAKAFIAPFFEVTPKPIPAGPAKPAVMVPKRRRGGPVTAPPTMTPDAPLATSEEEGTTVASDDTAVLTPVNQAEVADPNRILHDINVVAEALETAEGLVSGTVLASKQLEELKKLAGEIFPKVAGLSRRVHDSPTLKEKFDRIVQNAIGSGELEGQKRTLDRRCATRWNIDFIVLQAHKHFKSQVKILTDNDDNLAKYALSDAQWELVDELVDILSIFEQPTNFFSQAQVPLVHEVIPMMDTLIFRLKRVISYNSDLASGLPVVGNQKPLHQVTVLAATAALTVAEKYLNLTAECEVYDISIVMCPDKKLQYFKTRRTAEAQAKLQQLCTERFRTMFTTTATPQPQPSVLINPTRNVESALLDHSHGKSISPWLSVGADTSYRSYSSGNSVVIPDTMAAYLDEPLVSITSIVAAGGILKWWEGQQELRPNLTSMAIAYLTAPASSVDAERAFSEGRLSVNHLQHNMSSNTFRAKRALGSWYNTPLIPSSMDQLGEILATGDVVPKS